MRPNAILPKKNSLSVCNRPDQHQIGRAVLMKTILNTIHNLNVAVKSNENNSFKMLPQVINFKLLNFLTVFKFERQLSHHFFVETHFLRGEPLPLSKLLH